MSLDAAARRRYARQLLLGEIGEKGQVRLSEARFRSGSTSDADAFAVAAEYLRRAGCLEDPDGDEVAVPDASLVDRFAGEAFLRGPAAAVVGAFSAVEHMRAALGLGEARELPPNLSLTGES